MNSSTKCENDKYKKCIEDFFLNKEKYNNQNFMLGKMPLVYYLYGKSFYNSNLYISTDTIKHILKKHKYIIEDDIKNIYDYIKNPLIIFSGSEENTIVSILDYVNKNNFNIQVPIFFNYKNNNLYINAIGTIYQQPNLKQYIIKEILKHNLIAYNKKIESYVRSIGLLLPVEEEKYSIYDDSIIYTLKNVKRINENVHYYSFNTENKYFKPKFKATKNEIGEAIKEINMKIEDLFNLNNLQPYYDDEENLEKLHNILMNKKSKKILDFISKN